MYNNNPHTTHAICPQCGTQQEVDSAQDAAICRYCGKPFSVEKGISRFNERYVTIPALDDAPIERFPRMGQTSYDEPQKPRKKRIFWWVVGWIFCFPIPLTILVARSKRLSGLLKGIIIAVAWIAYLMLGVRSRSSMTDRTPTTTERTPAIVVTATPQPTIRPTASPTATPKPTEATEEAEAVEEAEDEAAEETPEPTPEPTPEATPAPAGVSPEFKETMDSYEAFFDEYCDFMKKMSDDPTDFTILMEYADVMTRYADIMDKLDAIDEDELSPADEAYYIEAMARIEVKLLEAANYMSE